MMTVLAFAGWIFSLVIAVVSDKDIRDLKKENARLKERLNPTQTLADTPSEEELVKLLSQRDRETYSKIKTRARMLHVKILHGKYYVNSGHDPIATKVHLADVRDYLSDLYKALEEGYMNDTAGAALMSSLYTELEGLQESLVQLEDSVKVDQK